jgi:deazaflavin-dependent oxidoreductase (nitroreductase family)
MSEPDTRERPWLILRKIVAIHTGLYRLSRGRVGHTVPGIPPMLLLEHRGAQSGTVRTTPLGYIRDGENLVVIASKGGHPNNPSWFHNLRVHPDARVQIRSTRAPVRARLASSAERERLWPEVVAVYAGYEDYQQRTVREIPLVILEPRRDERATA